jgi:hypothetical protein
MCDTRDPLGLSDALLGYWSARERFLVAGLSTGRSDPSGGLAEALAAAAFWPTSSVSDAYTRARGVRQGTDETGLYGPALGSMPTTWTGRPNALAVDLAMPWKGLIQRVPGLDGFAKRRQAERRQWDLAHGAALAAISNAATVCRFADMARVQVKARYAPNAPYYEGWDAVPFEVVRDGPVPAVDLVLAVLFAREDEDLCDLRKSNFVWTAVLMTNECLRQLDVGKRSGKLDWATVFSWWRADEAQWLLPAGAYDVTGLIRAVQISGWQVQGTQGAGSKVI